MINWFDSLQSRLIIGYILVLVLSLGGLTLFANYLAQREGERFQSEVKRARDIQFIREAQRISSEQSGPGDGQSGNPQTGNGRGLEWYLLIKDSDNRVVGASQPYELPVFGEGNQAWMIPLWVERELVGRLMVRPMNPNETTFDAPSPRLVSAFRSSLLWTGLVAAALGIGVIILLTRRILVPVRQLTTAAREVGRGQLSQDIPTKGNDEIGKLAQTFNRMTRELEEAETERQRMLADVAHELRTPLTNAQGYIEAIRDGLKQPSPQTIDAIYRQILQLHRLIDDLRLLTIAESGHLELQLESQPVADLLSSVVDAFAPRAQAKGITLSRDYSDGLPAITLDRSRISQVLGNLLENAIIHTPSGGSIAVKALHLGDRVVISVEDTGEGIPSEALPRVFDRLYRHDRSRNRASGGSGLGLSIAKQLIQAHGGAVGVESEVGVGTRFYFSLPVQFKPQTRTHAYAKHSV
jgi:signal transduction histidine kinase